MSAAKLDLPVESAGPSLSSGSSQEFSSSSHHSDVSTDEEVPCPPTNKSRGWVDATGIIWKNALACRMSPPLLSVLVPTWKTSTLVRISSKPDTPPATTKWYEVAPQPGP